MPCKVPGKIREDVYKVTQKVCTPGRVKFCYYKSYQLPLLLGGRGCGSYTDVGGHLYVALASSGMEAHSVKMGGHLFFFWHLSLVSGVAALDCSALQSSEEKVLTWLRTGPLRAEVSF